MFNLDLLEKIAEKISGRLHQIHQHLTVLQTIAAQIETIILMIVQRRIAGK